MIQNDAPYITKQRRYCSAVFWLCQSQYSLIPIREWQSTYVEQTQQVIYHTDTLLDPSYNAQHFQPV